MYNNSLNKSKAMDNNTIHDRPDTKPIAVNGKNPTVFKRKAFAACPEGYKIS